MLRTALKIAIPTTMSQRSGYGHLMVKDVGQSQRKQSLMKWEGGTENFSFILKIHNTVLL